MSRFRALPAAFTALALLAAASAVTLSAGAARAEGEAWKKGATWVSFRGGMAKSLADHAPNGNVGYGIGYHHVMGPHVVLGATVEHDLLGRFGGASLIEVPMGVEMLLQWRWKTPVHPYAGVGGGAYYRKSYRSGADYSDVQPGAWVKGGANTPIDASSLLGVEFKLASVSSDAPAPNPTFGPEPPSSGRFSAKLVYTRVY